MGIIRNFNLFAERLDDHGGFLIELNDNQREDPILLLARFCQLFIISIVFSVYSIVRILLSLSLVALFPLLTIWHFTVDKIVKIYKKKNKERLREKEKRILIDRLNEYERELRGKMPLYLCTHEPKGPFAINPKVIPFGIKDIDISSDKRLHEFLYMFIRTINNECYTCDSNKEPHCEPGKRRSLGDIYRVCLSIDPNVRLLDVLTQLHILVMNKLIKLSYCGTINKFVYNNDMGYHNENTKTEYSKYKMKEIVSILGYPEYSYSNYRIDADRRIW